MQKKIVVNSKEVGAGDIFLAIPCQDERKHIKEAFDRGASMVFAEEVFPEFSEKDIKQVKDARLFFARLAKSDYPNQPETCVAITGTNGKSSVAHFLKQIWMQLGKKSANLGTLGLFVGEDRINPPDIQIPNMTTPDAMTLHRILDYLYHEGVSNLVFEASSHALDQKRLHTVDLSAGAFTNFASDHMDYHRDIRNYLISKLRLFNEILPKNRPAIVPANDSELMNTISQINSNTLSFGIGTKSDIEGLSVKEFSDCMTLEIKCEGRLFRGVELNLFGTFQVLNILCAVAIAYSLGGSIDKIIETLPKIKPLSGRMEHIISMNGGDIYIDYAHTSEGFSNALSCFRKVCKKRLICVFGCGGDRDKTKRPVMGECANKIADVVIVTDDNPRKEPPEDIRNDILKGCSGAIEIGDRREAIRYAIKIMEPGDFVVLIGKGHEDYQIYANEMIRFSDKEEILKICAGV